MSSRRVEINERNGYLLRLPEVTKLLLRFFVACPPLSTWGCAPARRRIRVLTPCRHALPPPSARLLAATRDPVNHRHATSRPATTRSGIAYGQITPRGQKTWAAPNTGQS